MRDVMASATKTWIRNNVLNPHNNCFFYSAVLSRIFGYKLIEGRYDSLVHFWCENATGRIIDPTERQLWSGGTYHKKREVSAELNLDAVVDDPLFETLEPIDQWWVTRRWMTAGDPYFIVDA